MLCNNIMVAELAKILPRFSEVGHTRCFLHIVNLVAKSIIKQFDVPKAENGTEMDRAAQALASLAEGLDIEEEGAQDDSDEIADDRPLDGWIDFRSGLTDEEREQIDLSVQPVRATLTKVVTGTRVDLSRTLTNSEHSCANLHTR